MRNQPILSSGIFREYDIRGVVGETLHVEDAYAIGQRFAAKAASGVGAKIVVVSTIPSGATHVP